MESRRTNTGIRSATCCLMKKRLSGTTAHEQPTPTIYRIVGEHRADPARLPVLRVDGLYYALRDEPERCPSFPTRTGSWISRLARTRSISRIRSDRRSPRADVPTRFLEHITLGSPIAGPHPNYMFGSICAGSMKMNPPSFLISFGHCFATVISPSWIRVAAVVKLSVSGTVELSTV